MASRNYVQLTLLAPGSVHPDPQGFTNGQTTGNGARPYINGNREQANNFLLDGIDSNQVSDNLVSYAPSPDAIQEFDLIEQNASAEFGDFSGGIVSTNTRDITRFIALESRSYVVSVSGLLRREDIGMHSEWRRLMAGASPEVLADGGSCVAGPDGEWILPPAGAKEELLAATIDYGRVLEERQNFDLAGHYARPDVTQLKINRRRQNTLELLD